MKTLARGALAAALAAALIGPPGDARAQAQDGQVFQDWTVRCDENPGNAAAGGCYILQNVVNKETQQPVMQFAIGRLKSDGSPVAVITVPLGIRLPPGVAMQIDQQAPERMPVERCLPEGCKIQFRLSPEQIAAFKAGAGGQLTFQDVTGRSVPIPFSLKGFTAAIGALGS